MKQQMNVRQLTNLEIILYHLLPGIPILIFTLLFAAPYFGMGLSIFSSLMLAILFGLIPVQLGILFFLSKKEGKKIKEFIQYTHHMSVIQAILFALPCIIIALVIFGVVAPIEHPLWQLFNWVPKWFRLDQFKIDELSRAEAIPFLIVGILLNGLLGPFVEEVYFRGFLLPRMQKLGNLAPVVNTLLFSLYHFFTPWENITRILAIFPFVGVVYYKKNIRIGMVVHLSLNTLSMIGMIATFMRL